MNRDEHGSVFIRVYSHLEIFPALRAIVLGWLTLFVLAYLIELLLVRFAGILGPAWFPTGRALLACGELVAAGCVVGRSGPRLAVIVFAVTLTLRDFDPLLPLNVPWLLRLAIESMHDGRYLESLFGTAAGQALLFGCLFAGARLARPRSPRLRIGLTS
jgi:hypothetical protein